MGKDASELSMNERYSVNRKGGFPQKTKIKTVHRFDLGKTTENQMIAPDDHKIGDRQSSKVKPKSHYILGQYDSSNEEHSGENPEKLNPPKAVYQYLEQGANERYCGRRHKFH